MTNRYEAHRRLRTGAGILAALFLTVAGTAAATPDDKPVTLNDFNQGAELQLSGSGGEPFYRLTLPENVWLNSAHADLRDIRVFDSTGNSVPVALSSARQTSDEVIRVRFILWPLSQSGAADGQDDKRHIRLKADNGTELTIYNDNAQSLTRPATATYLLMPDNRKPLPVPLRDMTLAWPQESTNVQAKATLYSSDDKQNWTTVARDIPLMDLRSGNDTLLAQQITIPSYVSAGDRRAPYWLLSVTGDNGQTPPVITGADGAAVRVVDRSKINRFAFEAQAQPDHSVVYSLPNTQRLDRLGVVISQDNTVVPTRIEYRMKTEGDWLPLENTVLFSLATDGQTSRNTAIRLNNLPVRQVRLTAINGSWQDTLPQVTGMRDAQNLTFNAQGTPPYLLAWGSERAKSVAMPETQLLPESLRANPDNLPEATLSAIRTLGGPDKLLPAPAESEPFAWKAMLLWVVLGAGIAVLGFFAWRLFRELKPSLAGTDGQNAPEGQEKPGNASPHQDDK